MAKLVGAVGVPHAPLIARDWSILPEPTRAALQAAYLRVGNALRAAQPDVLIVVSPDHWTNFFLNNLPAFCIGIGARHDPPAEPFMREFPFDLMGDPALAQFLLAQAYAGSFEPSFSYQLRLDHGFCLPLWRLGFDELPKIIPVALNAIEPPMPTPARCVTFGQMLRRAIAAYPGEERIAIVASGGLSHSIGESTMGDIDARFDRAFCEALTHATMRSLLAFLDAELPRVGNGTHEIRNWLVAHGAVAGEGGGRFRLADYLEVPEVYVGCGFATWGL